MQPARSPAPPIKHLQMASRARGFTLVELMVTVAVLVVLLGIAAPNLQGVMNRNRVTGVANELLAAINTARMESIRQNRRAKLCPTMDGASCAGSDWSRLIIFMDANGNDAVDANEEVVRDFAFNTNGVSIRGSTNVATNNRLWFGADGLVRVGNAGGRSGGFSVCSTRLPAAENTRDVLVNVSRASVTSRGGGAECRPHQD